MPENFWLSLVCDLSEEAAEGPGWYIYAARPGAALIPVRRVTKAEANGIGQAFQGALDAAEAGPAIPVSALQLIGSGDKLIPQAINAQLEEAEKRALRVGKLRRLQAAEREEEESNHDVRRTGDSDGHERAHAGSEREGGAGGTADTGGSPGGTTPGASGPGDATADGGHQDPDVSNSGT